MAESNGTIHEANVYQVVAGLRRELTVRWENQQTRDAELRELVAEHAGDCLRRGLQADTNAAAIAKLQGSFDTLSTNVAAILSRPRNPNGRNGWQRSPVVIGSGGIGVGGAVFWLFERLLGG